MSPMLFLVTIDWIMRKTIGKKQRGIRWTLTSMLEDIDFADDIALLYEKTGKQNISTIIQQRRWRWLGHVMRKNTEL